MKKNEKVSGTKFTVGKSNRSGKVPGTFIFSRGSKPTAGTGCVSMIAPDGGQPVKIGQGDLVTFPAGPSCTWDIRAPVRKHYRFG